MLSNLFHSRDQLLDKREPIGENDHPELKQDKFDSGVSTIKGKIPQFDYYATLERLKDRTAVKELYDNCSNGYEKLQLFRLFNVDAKNSVIQKFINETYHIENEYICQLDPTKFDLIPEYVSLECDKLLALCES